MTAGEFCYWLQGYLELSAADKNTSPTLTSDQVACVQKHLELVFSQVTKEPLVPDLQRDFQRLCDGASAGIAGVRRC